MTILDKIQRQFAQHTEYHFAAAEILPRAIEHASEVLCQALLAGHKIFTCGNAGAGLLAHYFAAEMLNRVDKERPSLPAIALTQAYQYEPIFAKQIRSLAQDGDVLLAITTRHCRSLEQAVEAAHERNMPVICLIGQNDADLISRLNERDVAIAAPAETSAALLEIHLHILHTLFAALDYQLFGIED